MLNFCERSKRGAIELLPLSHKYNKITHDYTVVEGRDILENIQSVYRNMQHEVNYLYYMTAGSPSPPFCCQTKDSAKWRRQFEKSCVKLNVLFKSNLRHLQ
jgi:hypothetical protein